MCFVNILRICWSHLFTNWPTTFYVLSMLMHPSRTLHSPHAFALCALLRFRSETHSYSSLQAMLPRSPRRRWRWRWDRDIRVTCHARISRRTLLRARAICSHSHSESASLPSSFIYCSYSTFLVRPLFSHLLCTQLLYCVNPIRFHMLRLLFITSNWYALFITSNWYAQASAVCFLFSCPFAS